MTFRFSLARAFRQRLPFRHANVYVQRCDSEKPKLAIRYAFQTRETEYPLYMYRTIRIPIEAEDVEVVNPEPGAGELVLQVEQYPHEPILIATTPIGGVVRTGEVDVTGTPQALPDVSVMPGRDVVLQTPTDNDAPVYVNGFPIDPGYVLQVQVANLKDLTVYTDPGVGTQKLYWLCEARG